MQIGLVGLGRMGANMRDRMRRAGIDVTGYDQNPDVSDVAPLDALVNYVCELHRWDTPHRTVSKW